MIVQLPGVDLELLGWEDQGAIFLYNLFTTCVWTV